jgi:hypothetical protein
MATRLLLLLMFLRLGSTLPDVDDNLVPTDEEILNALLQQVTCMASLRVIWCSGDATRVFCA